MQADHHSSSPTPFTPLCLESIRQELATFAAERDWQQFHSPRNLLLALLSEVGEAADIVRWQGEAEPQVPLEQQQEWAHELADILIMLVRLADRSGVDLPQAYAEKLAIVRQRYSIEGFRGSNRKYR
ncbi:MAG: nucleotide pyrophosphohydrolase [Planctomycetota bacterium]|nr:MAG: nucleotide pyrophosphohydrolase [Planctomycetota bacterium]